GHAYLRDPSVNEQPWQTNPESPYNPPAPAGPAPNAPKSLPDNPHIAASHPSPSHITADTLPRKTASVLRHADMFPQTARTARPDSHPPANRTPGCTESPPPAPADRWPPAGSSDRSGNP